MPLSNSRAPSESLIALVSEGCETPQRLAARGKIAFGGERQEITNMLKLDAAQHDDPLFKINSENADD
jgi:hypothetical protein